MSLFHGTIQEMLDRIDANGVLILTMADIRYGVKFDAAKLTDIKYSARPAERARYIYLVDGDRKRTLKNSFGSV